MLDIYGGEQGMNPPNGGISPTSNPTKLTVKREYTGMNSYHSVKKTKKGGFLYVLTLWWGDIKYQC